MRRLSTAGRYIVLISFLAIIIAPFYWIVITSFKPASELGNYPPSLLPETWTLDHYREALVDFGFLDNLFNSMIVSVSATIVVLIFSSMAAFAIAKLPLPNKYPMMVGLLILSMFPPVTVAPAVYIMLNNLGLLNTYTGLVIPYIAFNLPFAVWLLRNYFVQIPTSLLESARVDGANVFTIFYKIYLPLIKPGLFTAAIFTYIATWIEFFLALIINSDPSMRTVSVGIALFSGPYSIPYGTIFAGSIIAMLPIVILTIIFRKGIISGLTGGAIKG
ncbi:carbohydrate ABC transporter permease [Oceanobacillus timonensis]|uniref:carbohydrate ABC transporter permease n=1 Tax=Oceanobacillus timonensis TaxID=1926285 RepID=UPI0009B98580|nr:carbohydrate ABC transporter permease [Oceanobacillus timonensis]